MNEIRNPTAITNNDSNESKYCRLSMIPWWEQDRLTSATIMVVGAGALGNELIKNLSLLGIGKILIVDMDNIEHSNLTRSVLFRMGDVGKYKAFVAAERAKEINPDVKAKNLNANIIDSVGLGVFRRMDIVLGGLDNREARLFINQSCWRTSKPFIDGAIEALSGFARVFLPPDGPCYECTMTETDWKLINQRKSCSLLTQKQTAEGKIPTTPTSSSIIAGIQVQEMLKLLHRERNFPTLAGKCYVFNGLNHDSFVIEYQKKDECMSHDTYTNIREMHWSVNTATLGQILNFVKSDMGEEASIIFDREIATVATCICGHSIELFKPIHVLEIKDLACSQCGREMNFSSTHSLNGTESFLEKTAGEIGVPVGHILIGRNQNRYRYYEFTDDIWQVLEGLL